MSKRQWLSILGVWIMIFLFLGVPSLWHKIIAIISGLIVIAFAYNLPHEKSDEIKTEVKVDNFNPPQNI